MTKVYIPNRGAGHDYSKASEIGDLIYVTEGLVSPFNTGWMVRKWDDALSSSEPGDYIVMTSLLSLCSIGASMFAYKHGTLNLLIFTRDGEYERREIIL